MAPEVLPAILRYFSFDDKRQNHTLNTRSHHGGTHILWTTWVDSVYNKVRGENKSVKEFYGSANWRVKEFGDLCAHELNNARPQRAMRSRP